MSEKTDFVSVMVVLAALIFSPQVAALVGPYVAIILASSIGGSFALMRRDTSARGNAFLFFFRVVGLAVLLTSSAAGAASAYYPQLQERWLLAPIAGVIGLVGDDWGNLWRWAFSKLNALVDAYIKLRGGGGNG